MPRIVGFQFLKPLIAGSIYPATATRCASTYRRRYLEAIQSPSMSFLPCMIPTCCIPTSASCRLFSRTVVRRHGHIHDPKPGEEIHVTFITREGDQVHIDAAEGDNLLDIAQAQDLDMEGACGGSCACSTCHVIVDPEFYDLIPEPDDDENDMLDLAFGLTETSRLGCQVKLTKELDGLRVALPQMTRNLQAKDFEKR
ncbi:2Fe-2S ferredoxin-type domain-containing protein [Lipomyces doorenjongii]|uniref:2Fe-2S ferredoxin-type domain-containing protein n=1 Tax=Lipomyces doorenjongii TaxID=383834 RepID=UPI0034CEC61A